MLWGGGLETLHSALTACNFFLRRQEKVTKKKATPALRARLRRVPCATRTAGRLRNSDLRSSNNPRRRPPAALRCSALHEGGGKAHRTEPMPLAVDARLVFNWPSASSSSARRNGKEGRGLSEGQNPSSAALPLRLSSAETPAQAGRRCGRAFSLATFFLQEKGKYARASGAEPSLSAKITRLKSSNCRPTTVRGMAKGTPAVRVEKHSSASSCL